jgi:hypothetical protein
MSRIWTPTSFVVWGTALEKPDHSFESKLVLPWMKSSVGGDP